MSHWALGNCVFMFDKSKKITTLYKKKTAGLFNTDITIKNTDKFIHPGTVKWSSEVCTVVMYYTRKKNPHLKLDIQLQQRWQVDQIYNRSEECPLLI